ncbi:MAG TPA: hypothetical protein VGO63_00775 [Candidatus Paceibacterota bacterium]|jgi:hypothetical protein|nr:hypothetical protein [Candidatus Paceibacterota bacterium]
MKDCSMMSLFLTKKVAVSFQASSIAYPDADMGNKSEKLVVFKKVCYY